MNGRLPLLVLLAGILVAAEPGDVDPRQRPSAWPFRIAPAPADAPKVFAHYLPFFVRSFDDLPGDQDYYARNFLAVDGESGKWIKAGGFLRQRPLPRSSIGGDRWRRADLRWEIRLAKTLGIDGFCVDLLALSGRNWQTAVDLAEVAAEEGGFTIVPMPDLDALADEDDALVDALRQYAAIPSIHRLADGRVVLAPYNAQTRDAGWWRRTLDRLRDAGIPVAFWPVMQHLDQHWEAFLPLVDGFSEWGERVPLLAAVRGHLAAKAHAAGKRWMQTVSPQDSRPKEQVIREAANTQLWRTSWELARRGPADCVQLVTWNDYAESTAIAPTDATGWVYADLTAYFTAWYKQGMPPPITRDALYLVHRQQILGAAHTDGRVAAFRLIPPGTGIDQVEAVAFLSAPAEVVVGSGSATGTESCSAGLATAVVELRTGRPWAEIRRAGKLVARLDSAWTVVTDPAVPDPLYHGTGP